MATFTFDNPTWEFPEGTTVLAYRDKGQPPGEAPAGNPTSSATVTNGNLTIANLTELTPYFATAFVGNRWRRIRFTTDPGTTTGGGTGGGPGGPPVDISGKEDKSNKGMAGGYTPLDSSNLVPFGHLQRVTPGEVFVDALGAAGDGVTDDTNVIRFAINLAVSQGAGTVRFGAHPYLVNGDPLTTADGNAILPLPVSSAFGLADQLLLKGVPGRTRIKTTRTGDAYSGTFGPPSIIGGPTFEQVSPDTSYFSQRWVRIHDIKVEAPLNPAIAGIDLSRVVRTELRRTTVTITGGLYDSQQPTNQHAFGIRTPDYGNYGRVDLFHCQVDGFYCGFALTSCHTLLQHCVANACYVGHGLKGSGDPTIDTQQSVGVAVGAQHNVFPIAGYTPATGVQALPLNRPFLMDWYFGTEDIFPGHEDPSGDWRQTDTHILDPNNQIHGRMRHHHVEGYVGPADYPMIVSGGENLQRSAMMIPPRTVAAETTPVSGTEYQNTYDDNHHTTMRVRVQMSPSVEGHDTFFPLIVDADNPLAFYRLDEGSGTTATDAVGAHNGTYVDGPTLTDDGPVGDFTTHTSANFDGTDDHALLTTLGTFGNNLLNSSYEFWIKTATTSGQRSVFGTANAGSTMAVECAINTSLSGLTSAGKMTLFTRGNNGQALNAEAFVQQMYDDTWHHVLWVTQGGIASGRHQCFLDGQEVATTASVQTAQTVAPYTSPMVLAARNVNGTIDRFADINLANVAFYPTRLTLQDAQQHYGTGTGAATSSLEVSEDGTTWQTWQSLRADPGIANARTDGYTFPWPPRTYYRVTHSGATSINAIRSSSRS